MSTIVLFITNIVLLMMAIISHFDTRRPSSAKLKYKYRVKDNSILRKIIRFKDKQFYPCNYFKIIPIYAYIILSLISFVILLIDLFSNFYITNNYQIVLIVVHSIIFIASILYAITIIFWWELVDYKESKFTKEEKKLLNQQKSQKSKEKK